MNFFSRIKNGYSFVEVMLVVAILSFLVAATYGAFLSGQTIWNRTANTIEMDEQLNKATQRIAAELKWTGHDSQGQFQLSYITQSGINESDIFKFSIPVICQPNGNPVDGNGDTAHWGAPLTWGCSESSCMDSDGNCDTVEYKYIEYRINDKNQLVRRVLDFTENVVKEDVVAENISNLKIEPNFDQRMIKVVLTASKNAAKNKIINQELRFDVHIKNAR